MTDRFDLARMFEPVPEMVAHDIPLRPKVLVRLTLPRYLTEADAERLCGIIRALAFRPEATPEDRNG